MPEENNLVILGDEDVVLGFRALGFKIYTAEFEKALDEIVEAKTGICLVQDNIYKQQEEKINSLRRLALPIFIPFTKDSRLDLLDSIVKDIRIRATGAF